MTKKPISTISFNTENYLLHQLDCLVKSTKVESWMYVRHKAEEDTKKDHIHMLLIPCSPVNPVNVRKMFVEPTFDGSGDLCCLPFVTSKVTDWLLYALHYKPYLLSKGLFRIHSYDLSCICSNESSDYISQVYNDALETMQNNRINQFIELQNSGMSFGDILAQGVVPPNQVVFFDKLYRLRTRHGSENCNTNDCPF